VPEFPREVEVGRIVDLVKAMGWEKVKEELIGRDLHITFKKTFLTEEEMAKGPAPG